QAAAAVPGAGADATVGVGEDGRNPDGRHAPADHRWAHGPAVALHRARTGPVDPAPPIEDRLARSARPRGFIQRWSPRAETRELLDQVNQILGEYVNLLPLTARQIFYRLVGAYGHEKTEQASERLGETLNKARRACLVDMD